MEKTKNKFKFKLYDLYDTGILLEYTEDDLVGRYKNKQDLARGCTEYGENCENQCIFHLLMLNETTDKYEVCPDWFYTKRTVKIN